MAVKSNDSLTGEAGQFIDVDGVSIHYYEEGYGTPVVFIHGIGQSMFTFRNNIPDFAACFRAIALDLPGHGQSDPMDGDYLIEDYSEILLSFLNALNIEACHLFAFSTGAIIAMDFALAFPERVKKLILISPGGVTETFPAGIRNLLTPLVGDMAFTFFGRNQIRKILQTAYFDRTRISESIIDNYYENLADKSRLDAAVTTLQFWDDETVSEHLHTLNNSVYIFWGENDAWHPLEDLESFEEQLPNVYAATVRNGGHMIHEEKHRELNRKAIELLLTDDIT